MHTYAPDYYYNFKCIADKCKHTCCKGWEIEIDADSLARFCAHQDIMRHVSYYNNESAIKGCITDDESAINGDLTNDDSSVSGIAAHFMLKEDETCPFLLDDGLCKMILTYGEDMLCQTCTDHPRFRNYWSDRIEIGLGLVCEEAARIILSSDHPLRLAGVDNITSDISIIGNTNNIIGAADYRTNNSYITSTDDINIGEINTNTYIALNEDERWLLDERDYLLSQVTEDGPFARLKEYLIYRHIPDALYDDRLEERIQYIDYLIELIKDKYNNTDKSFESLVDCAREISYDYEYDEEMKEKLLNKFYIENTELVLLTEADKEAVYALYQSALGSPGCVWSESYPSKELLDEDIKTHSLYGLFSKDDELIAAIAIDRDEEVESLPYWSKSLQPSKEVARLVVSLEYRNLGIARNMIKKIMPILKTMGNKSIHYLVSDDNPQAKRSYESLKFNEVGHVHMYDEDFICYEKAL